VSGADLRDIWVHVVGTGGVEETGIKGAELFEFFYQRYVFKKTYFLNI
jgi:hypothetical protein